MDVSYRTDLDTTPTGNAGFSSLEWFVGHQKTVEKRSYDMAFQPWKLSFMKFKMMVHAFFDDFSDRLEPSPGLVHFMSADCRIVNVETRKSDISVGHEYAESGMQGVSFLF